MVSDGLGGCTACGNGVLDPGEGCDDGNIYSGDGCSNACVIENGYWCLHPGGPCQQESLRSEDLIAYYPLTDDFNDYSSYD